MFVQGFFPSWMNINDEYKYSAVLTQGMALFHINNFFLSSAIVLRNEIFNRWQFLLFNYMTMTLSSSSLFHMYYILKQHFFSRQRQSLMIVVDNIHSRIFYLFDYNNLTINTNIIKLNFIAASSSFFFIIIITQSQSLAAT